MQTSQLIKIFSKLRAEFFFKTFIVLWLMQNQCVEGMALSFWREACSLYNMCTYRLTQIVQRLSDKRT